MVSSGVIGSRGVMNHGAWRSLSEARCRGSTKREAEELHAWLEELDLEGALADRSRLADELVGPLLGDTAIALGIDVGAVRAGCRLAIETHPEWDRGAARGRPHHQVHITSLESDSEPGVRRRRRGGTPRDRPAARRR